MNSKLLMFFASSFLVMPATVWAQPVPSDPLIQLQKDRSLVPSQQQQEANKLFQENFTNIIEHKNTNSSVMNRGPKEKDIDGFTQLVLKNISEECKKDVAANTTLTDGQKNELTGFFVSQFSADNLLRDRDMKTDMAFFAQVANDPDTSVEQKKAAIRDYFVEQKNSKQ